MQQQPVYFKSLDALRFLSFVAIFTFHFKCNVASDTSAMHIFFAIKNALFLGVDFFFVLSSFLLTYLALQEHKNTANFSFKKFMMRRVLRIWPLYFLMVIGGFALLPMVVAALHLTVTLPPVWYYLIFASNFYTLPHVFFLMFLWSIAVEEQLYLLFAFAYKFFIKHLFAFSILLLSIYITYICLAVTAHWPVYYTTVNYLPNFATGALLALAFFKSDLTNTDKEKQLFRLPQFSSMAILFIYAVTFLLIVLSIHFTTGILSQLLSKLLMCFFFAFAITDQVLLKNSPFKLERLTSLTWLGKRTYGLYCYHGIVFTLYTLIPEPFKTGIVNQLTAYIAAMLITILLAAISYRFFESRFLMLKKRFY